MAPNTKTRTKLVALLLAISFSLLAFTQSTSAQKSESPRIWLSKSTVTLECGPGRRPHEGWCTDLDQTVSIVVAGLKEGSFPEFVVEAGNINPSGNTALWNLKGVGEGQYELRIFQRVEGNRKLVGIQSITVEKCKNCNFQPVCPDLTLRTKQSRILRGEEFQILLAISGGVQEEPDIRWNVENAQIIDGRGTSVLVVKAPTETTNKSVVKVSARFIDAEYPQCSRAVEKTFSFVPSGEKTKASIELDQSRVRIPCGPKCLTGDKSDCSIPNFDVRIRVRNRLFEDKVNYSVSGGKVLHTPNGSAIWNFDRTPPGEYEIVAKILREGSVEEIGRKKITVRECNCQCDVTCAHFEIEADRSNVSRGEFVGLRVKQFGELKTRGNVYEPRFRWSIKNGKLVGDNDKENAEFLMSGNYVDGFAEATVNIYSDLVTCTKTLTRRIPVFADPDYRLKLDRQYLRLPKPPGYGLAEGASKCNVTFTNLVVESRKARTNVSFRFRSEYGEIYASGNKATWKLEGQNPGDYKVYVDVFEDGRLVTILERPVVMLRCQTRS